jgi:plasmid stabilization system protein ParE
VKRYVVLVTPEAEAGIIGAFHYIHDRSPANAAKWLRSLYKQIGTLEQMPGRCAMARESQYFDEELRCSVFKSHRIVFRVEETNSIVRVLFVRHVKQRPAGEPGASQAADE